MKAQQISKSTISFLKDLAKNNDREWFNLHKQDYLQAQQNMADFADALIKEMNKHDVLENESGKKSLFRIYNDVRFSKDKSPYNARFAFSLRRASKYRRGGYYFNLKPGNTYLACGFFNPNPEDLKRIRQDIDQNFSDWNKIIKRKSMKEIFHEIQGAKVLTSPKGYSKEHPAIELLRLKQFIFRYQFDEKEIYSVDFFKNVNTKFKAIRPWFDYMSELLTSDANGERII